MSDDLKAQALQVWQLLLTRPEVRMNAQEQYEELLRLAEQYSRLGYINSDERKVLVTEATKRYAQAVEGAGGGT